MPFLRRPWVRQKQNPGRKNFPAKAWGGPISGRTVERPCAKWRSHDFNPIRQPLPGASLRLYREAAVDLDLRNLTKMPDPRSSDPGFMTTPRQLESHRQNALQTPGLMGICEIELVKQEWLKSKFNAYLTLLIMAAFILRSSGNSPKSNELGSETEQGQNCQPGRRIFGAGVLDARTTMSPDMDTARQTGWTPIRAAGRAMKLPEIMPPVT